MTEAKPLNLKVGQVWEGSDGWRYKILLIEDGGDYPVVARRLAPDSTPLGVVDSFKLTGEVGADGYRLKKLVPKAGTAYVNVWRDGSVTAHKGLKDATLGAPTDRGGLIGRAKVKYKEGKFEA